jgi:VanZ family protein
MSASNTSRWLLPIWVHLFGRIEARTWAEINLLIRKLGHFTGYGLLSVAFFHGWRYSLQTKGPKRSIWRLSAGLAVLCAVTVAAADEYHQKFLQGRSGSTTDVGIDFCGAIVAQCIVLMVMPCLFRTKQKDR